MNKYEELIQMLNNENNSILFSNEYIRGKFITEFMEAVRKRNLKEIKNLVHNFRTDKFVHKHYVDISEIIDNNSVEYFDTFDNPDSNYSITIYSCITAGYDIPQIPFIRYPNYTYILFSDQEFNDVKGWELRKIPDTGYTNPAVVNRYIKFHPDEFFKTDYTFYIDGNIRLMTGVSDFFSLSKSYYGIGMFDHFSRRCAYREAEACIVLGKGNRENIKREMKMYEREKFPHMFGLKEANVIGTDLNNQNAIRLLHIWWDEYIKWESGRDQLALPYIIWKDGHLITDVFSFGSNMRNDSHFQLHSHSSK